MVGNILVAGSRRWRILNPMFIVFTFILIIQKIYKKMNIKIHVLTSIYVLILSESKWQDQNRQRKEPPQSTQTQE